MTEFKKLMEVSQTEVDQYYIKLAADAYNRGYRKDDVIQYLQSYGADEQEIKKSIKHLELKGFLNQTGELMKGIADTIKQNSPSVKSYWKSSSELTRPTSPLSPKTSIQNKKKDSEQKTDNSAVNNTRLSSESPMLKMLNDYGVIK
jgi:hypothetical protein